MIPLDSQKLSDGLREVLREINRGAWLADRLDGIDITMPREIQVTANVVVSDGDVAITGIETSEVGASTQTGTQTGTQSTSSTTDTAQRGGNTTTETRDYEELT